MLYNLCGNGSDGPLTRLVAAEVSHPASPPSCSASASSSWCWEQMRPAAGSRQESGLSAARSTKTTAEHSCLDKSRHPGEGGEGCREPKDIWTVLRCGGKHGHHSARQDTPPLLRDTIWRLIHFRAVDHPTDTMKKSHCLFNAHRTCPIYVLLLQWLHLRALSPIRNRYSTFCAPAVTC